MGYGNMGKWGMETWMNGGLETLSIQNMGMEEWKRGNGDMGEWEWNHGAMFMVPGGGGGGGALRGGHQSA